MVTVFAGAPILRQMLRPYDCPTGNDYLGYASSRDPDGRFGSHGYEFKAGQPC